MGLTANASLLIYSPAVGGLIVHLLGSALLLSRCQHRHR